MYEEFGLTGDYRRGVIGVACGIGVGGGVRLSRTIAPSVTAIAGHIGADRRLSQGHQFIVVATIVST